MKGLILFAHGARDPRWAEPFERLRGLLLRDLSGVRVELAYLELMSPDLPTVVRSEAAAGCTVLTIVPVFLGQGGHVRRDLPELVEKLRVSYPAVEIRCALPAGEDGGVLAALAEYCKAQMA